MKIEWEGSTYTYEPEDIDIKQATVIKMHTGMGLVSWERACNDMEPAACQALMWVIKAQNGEITSVSEINCKPMKLIMAIGAGYVAESKNKTQDPAPDPTESASLTPGPTPT